MKVHAILSAEAQKVLRGKAAGNLESDGKVLLGKLERAGLKGINVARAIRHGIVSGDLAEPELAGLRALPEVDTVEIDGVMRAL